MENNKNNPNFVSIAFNINMKDAQNQYKEELKNNIDGVWDKMLSFEQWLSKKKYEVLKYEVENFAG